MRIDGFGSEVGPILAFGTELRRAFGSKAAVEVRQITSRQCPAIGLIGRLLKSRTPELHVMLDAQSVNSGGELHGDVDGVRHPWLSLLLVDDDGKIHDISSYLRKSNDSWSFTVKVFLTAEGKGRNQLIVAVASQQELEQFSSGEQAASLDSFADVVAKAAASQSDIAIGLSAFRVE